MLVAVTGGTGFVGRALVEAHRSRGDVVRVLSRLGSEGLGFGQDVQVYQGDLTDGKATFVPFVDGAGVLYHCAGELQNRDRMYSVHVEGTRRLLRASSGRIERWVQLSSVGAYGEVRSGVVTEETPESPVGVYEKTKVASDCLVRDCAENGMFSYTIVRPSNIYGEGMSNRSLFSLIEMIDRGWFVFVGPKGAFVNYIHVDNVAHAMMLCAGSPRARGEVYNLSEHCAFEQFVETIASSLGRRTPRVRLAATPVRVLARCLGRFRGFPLTESRIDAMTNRVAYCSRKIQEELGYIPVISMEVGLRRLVSAWRKER